MQYDSAEILDLNSVDHKLVIIESLTENQINVSKVQETHQVEVYSTEISFV